MLKEQLKPTGLSVRLFHACSALKPLPHSSHVSALIRAHPLQKKTTASPCMDVKVLKLKVPADASIVIHFSQTY